MMESQMTHSETGVEDIEDIETLEDNEDIEEGEDIELIEAIEPGSLEWFRLHAPLPLLLQALLEDPNNRAEFSGYENETAKSACKRQTEFWDMLITAESLAEWLALFDDPNAKAIVARLRMLTGCDGRLAYTGE
jgi:hypothetical protein